MNDEQLQSLYNGLLQQNLVSPKGSFEGFRDAYSTPESQRLLYDGLLEKKLVDPQGSFAGFQAAYFTPTDEVKKKEEGTPTGIGLDRQKGSETPAIPGVIGDVIRSVPYFGDFVDDIYRAAENGVHRGEATTEVFKGAFGGELSDDDLADITESLQRINELGVSDEAVAFQQEFESADNVFDQVYTMVANPTAMAEVMVGSIAQMVRTVTERGGLAAMGAGAAAAAPVGLAGGPLAEVTVPAAALSGAVGALSGSVDATSSIIDVINEELRNQNLEVSKGNLRKVFQDRDAIDRMRNLALGRGIPIAVFDAMTMGVAGKVVGALGKGVKGVAAGAAVEVTGAGLGEFSAQVVSGQPINTGDILLEAAAEGPMVMTSLITNKKGKYSINGRRVSNTDIESYIKSGENLDNVQVENDRKMQALLENEREIQEIARDLPEDMAEADRNRTIELEREKKKLAGSILSFNKRRISAIDKELDQINDRYVKQKPDEDKTATEETKSAEEIRVELEKNQREALGGRSKPIFGFDFFPRLYDVKTPLGRFRKVVENALLAGGAMRKQLPADLRALVQDATNRISVEANQLKRDLRQYKRLLPVDEKTSEAANDYLSGDENAGKDFSDEQLSFLDGMRSRIDGFSQRLIDEGLVSSRTVDLKDADGNEVPSSMADIIKANIGKYLRTTYESIENKNYVPDEIVRNKAKDKLLKDMDSDPRFQRAIQTRMDRDGLNRNEALEAQVEDRINSILTNKERDFLGRPNIGKVDKSSLKRQKDIPAEIRALMGEVKDPWYNYAKSIETVVQLYYKEKMFADIAKTGENLYFFREGQIPAGQQNMFTGKIPNDPGYGALAGMRTTPLIEAEIVGSVKSKRHPVALGYARVLSGAKWMKTIGSIPTHLLNFYGNIGFVIANGHWRLGKFSESLNTVFEDVKKMPNAERRALVDDLIARGVIRQSVTLGDVNTLLKGDDIGAAFDSRVHELTAKGAAKKARKGFLTVKGAAEGVYQGTDDLFKIFGYLNEINEYSQIEYGKRPSELSAEELAKMKDFAAYRTRNGYPDYSQVYGLAKIVSKSPLIGPFVSYTAESYRVGFNLFHFGYEDISRGVQTGNAKLVAKGAQRLFLTTGVMSSKTAVQAMTSVATVAGVSGLYGELYDSPEEKEKRKNITPFLEPWVATKDGRVKGWTVPSDILVWKAEDGEIVYFNYSAKDAFGAPARAMNQAFESARGRGVQYTDIDMINAFVSGMKEVLSPFVAQDFLAKKVEEVFKNEGSRVYNDTDSGVKKFTDITAHLLEGIEPGTLTAIRRIDTSQSASNAAATFFGVQARRVDVKQQFGYLMFDYANQVRKIRRNNATKEEKEKQIRAVYEDAAYIFKSAQKLGVSYFDLMENRGGLSKKDLIRATVGNLHLITIKE